MGKIQDLIENVNKTHNGLGNLVAMCVIVVKARKLMLIVSPSGCGKSTAMSYVGNNTPNSWLPTSLSIASLASKVEKLNSFRSVIVIDDIANINTDYGRITTINTLSALCYSHRVEPSMFGFDFSIEDFYGSALIGIQPVKLRELMLSSDWEASVQDKSLRYYHLIRPHSPLPPPIPARYDKGIEFDAVKDFDFISNPLWTKLHDLGMMQWSKSRTREHLVDYLKAIAALENRKDVENSDFQLLYELLKPVALEVIATTKNGLESERILDNNLLALLTEYY